MSINESGSCNVLHKIVSSGEGRIHISGVLGVSTSSLGELLAMRGISVSGSDDAAYGMAEGKLGCDVKLCPPGSAEGVASADVLVYSSAISEMHPDRRMARDLGIPEYSRAELLGEMMMGYGERIGISGTHGKSTTTAMLGKIFTLAGFMPTVLCGAELEGGKCYIVGREDHLIYEACEYRDSFLHFSPTCAIITNIELDHTDYFKDIEVLERSFVRSVSGCARVVISIDYPASATVAAAIGAGAITVGRSRGAEYRYRIINSWRFELFHREMRLCEFRVGICGEHNIANAAMAAAVAHTYGISLSDIAVGLADFCGISKRLEKIGELGDRIIYRDYAHHPTEIKAAISTLKELHGRVAVLFRPHTYSRTRDLWSGFIEALSVADEVGICEIYPAREKPQDGVSAEALARDIHGAVALGMDECEAYIRNSKSEVAVLLGAGELTELERKFRTYKGDR